ncbi:helix-turn-helix transcriptional regulator [Actinoplanes italicus]|uniref:Putative ATPase n=1 Tax=Actinoplanes italicus TaxID=113567 RepID=A0A2T0K3J7_9ACTN|nr:LuxR family transcriptional regulator [Actinoplanes italicus]PRX17257.1 putative ATPase [Actinoplanes italicus]GIE35185.1 helix-turn-helix transcriptional regulator [Actinoplanes italicus]
MAEAPFVGRTAEMELLTQRLDEVRQGQSRTVLVGGDAGIGKSRLLSLFAGAARQAGAHVLSGSCEEHFGDPMPYGPLLEVLEAFDREYGRKLGGPAFQRLIDFFDSGSDEMKRPQHVFLAVRRMLQDIGADAPVVLIIEDVHWADLSTLDLVRHLAQARPEDRRLLLLCSYRSRDLRHDDPLWQLLAGATFWRRTERIELPALTLPELREFLSAERGRRVDPRLVERCFDWSDGIPFYAEQLIAAGALESSEDVQLPADIRSVVLARLSGLSADALKVLRVAAVAGRAVSRLLLRRVSELSGEALGDAVQECFDRRMLVTGRDEDVYRFRHALLREAVYQTTVRDSRVHLHMMMAEALTADPGLSSSEGSAAAELASHWYQAGSWPQALVAAVRAGEIAARTLAFPSAEIQFTRALRLWQRVQGPGELSGVSPVQLLVWAAEAARWSGDVDRALDHITQAVATAGPDRAGELRERLGTYLWEVGRRVEAVTTFREAEALLTGRPASAARARVLAGLALAHLHAGRYAEGRDVADAALRAAVEAGARAEEGRALNISGLALGMLGDPEGIDRLRRAVDIAQQENHIEDLLRAYGNLGLILENGGRLREAAELTMKGLQVARQLDLVNTVQAMILANNASAAFVLLGEWDDAEKIITEVLLDRPAAESLYPRLTLAEVKVARGRYDQAHELLASIENVEHGDDPRFLGPLHTVRALLALAEGDMTRAGEEVARGVTAVRGGENRLELLRLCAVGLRCAADRAVAGDLAGATAAGDRLANEGWDAQAAQPAGEVAQLVLLCRAERRRLRGTDTAVDWSEVATGWARLDRPYEAAYARWRQAVAACARNDVNGARQPAREAHQAAKALAAEPLRAAVALLAGRIGLDLADRPAPAKLPYDLTPAEFETLRYLCEGKDTAGIASARGVTRRTVETQLGRVYRKLDVRSVGEAIAKAYREGLVS